MTVGPSEADNNFNQNSTKVTCLSTHTATLQCYAKNIENFEFVQCVNFEFKDSLKNNGTKYLLTFEISCGKIFKSKAFVDNAAAGRQRGLDTSYI